MLPGLVVCHGDLGGAFLEALEGIFGRVTDFEFIGNRGRSADELLRVVSEAMDRLGSRGLVFTDYFGGSCATACVAALRGREGYRVVSGVNLPMLIYFLTHRDEMALDDILPGVIYRGRNAIRELLAPGL